MSLEEELFLADSNDSGEIFLADSTPAISHEAGKEEIIESNEVEEIYTLLRIAEKPEKLDFKEYFKSNPEIFKIAGVDYYKPLSQPQYETFEKKCSNLILQANKKWRSVSYNYKIADLDDALGTLKSIFRNEASTRAYSLEIKRVLNEHLKSLLKQKLDDGILEVSEIAELMELAISIHLISDSEKGRKAIFDWIRNTQKKVHFVIEDFRETFSRLVSQKQKIERLNVAPCLKKLFEDYKKLSFLNSQINDDVKENTDSDLYSQMTLLLQDKNLLIDNVLFYKEDFFEKIKKEFVGNFALPHTNEDFYYYKGTAKNLYHLSEEQWNEFIRVENLKKEGDASLAFIMGTEKASTISDIANLLEENPNMALSRIRAGDVETYLLHIGQLEMAKKLSSIKEILKNDTDVLVQSVVNLLRGIDSSTMQNDEEISSSDSLLPLIEAEASPQELVSYLLRRKQFENLNKKILSPKSNEHSELEKYLFSKGFSFIKICMNYLHKFPKENNALAYKNMYGTYANYVLSSLVEENDYITFITVFKPILEEIDKNEYLSSTFIEKYKESENLMMLRLNEEKTAYTNKTVSKPKKSFFGFRK